MRTVKTLVLLAVALSLLGTVPAAAGDLPKMIAYTAGSIGYAISISRARNISGGIWYRTPPPIWPLQGTPAVDPALVIILERVHKPGARLQGGF